MSEQLDLFWESVKKEEAMMLAACAENRVTMRTVSMVPYEGAVLMCTDTDSLKYRQMKANPSCCFAVGGCTVEAEVHFYGPAMDDANAAKRAVYDEKFKGAFEEGRPL